MGESFQKLNLTNAYLFAAAMQDEEICRNVLEIALNKQLKPGYIIFICSFDPFGKGRCQYVFEEYCKEADIPLGDETQKIFFNTNGTDTENVTPELLHLFEYLKQSTEEVAVRHQDEKILKIHERVKYLKRDRKLEAGYMTMEEYIHQEAERRAKLMAESMVKSMAETMAESMAESMAETMAKPMAETMAETMAKSMAESMAKPMAESMAKPMAESMAESMAASRVAQNILALLEDLGTLPDQTKERIAKEQNEDVLSAWLKLAARADSIEEFQSKM